MRLKNWSAWERYWTKKRIVYFLGTVTVYLLWGVELAEAAARADGFPVVAMHFIVFGGIAIIVHTLIDMIDPIKPPGKRR